MRRRSVYLCLVLWPPLLRYVDSSVAELVVGLPIPSLLARRRGLAGHVEGETQAALHRKTHRPSLHSHIIPHGDGVEEGAGAVLARRHEADRLPPGRVLARSLPSARALPFLPRGADRDPAEPSLATELHGEVAPVPVVDHRREAPLRLV